jgi:hypothetical protein
MPLHLSFDLNMETRDLPRLSPFPFIDGAHRLGNASSGLLANFDRHSIDTGGSGG